MGRYVFRLPDIGEGMAEAAIAQWHIAVGDRVEEDQPLVDLETDKAIVEIPAPISGTAVSIHGAVGAKVAVGSELVVFETDAEASAQVATTIVAKEIAATAIEGKVSEDSKVLIAKPVASPAVRKRARELGIELHAVQGSGPGERVTHADLDAFLNATRRSALPAPQHSASSEQEVISEHPVVGIRRRIAERMQESKRHIPHFSYVEEVDVTELEELRLYLNKKYFGKRPKLTPLSFVVRALVRAVREYPEVNARFDDEKGVVHRHTSVHIGIATQTPNGLMVPVVVNAHTRNLWDCVAEMNRLTAVAREGQATRGQLSGSTITITSLGALGGIASTPVINYPEVAIVGINRVMERPVVRSNGVVIRKMMNLSSSFDHRVIDGWNAASFIQEVKRFLEVPTTLFLD